MQLELAGRVVRRQLADIKFQLAQEDPMDNSDELLSVTADSDIVKGVYEGIF